jgi:hypothetical protein
MAEVKRTFALVGDGVCVWTWNDDGTVQPPLVLRPGMITDEELAWARAEIIRLRIVEQRT